MRFYDLWKGLYFHFDFSKVMLDKSKVFGEIMELLWHSFLVYDLLVDLEVQINQINGILHFCEGQPFIIIFVNLKN